MLFREFWIDPELDKAEKGMMDYILQLQDGACLTGLYGGSETLHVTTVEEVKKKYKSHLMLVSSLCIDEMSKRCVDLGGLIRPAHQIASICLTNLNIAATGFNREETESILMMISMLGGNFVSVIDIETNILIAATAASEKTYVAFANGIPVLTIKWLKSCYENLAAMPFSGFNLPRFRKCKLCSSDLTKKERRTLSTRVRNAGGRWCDAYDEDVTFLVSHSLTMSKKISLALAANVPIVSPEWILSETSLMAPTSHVLNWWSVNGCNVDVFKGAQFDLSDVISDALLQEVIVVNGGRVGRPAQFRVCLDGSTPGPDGVAVSARWVWKCVSERRLLDVSASPTFSPFAFKRPVDHITGEAIFLRVKGNVLRVEIAMALRDLGAVVYYAFSRNARLIISESYRSKDASLAREYGIPIVGVSWFSELIRTGRCPNFSAFPPTQKSRDIAALCRSLKCSPNTRSRSEIFNFSGSQSSPVNKEAVSVPEIGYKGSGDSQYEEPTGADPLLAAFGG